LSDDNAETVSSERDVRRGRGQINDIVVYRLSVIQMNKKIEHISGCTSTCPSGVSLVGARFNVILKPLWIKGKEVRRPTSQVRLVASRIPESLRGTIGGTVTAAAPEMREPILPRMLQWNSRMRQKFWSCGQGGVCAPTRYARLLLIHRSQAQASGYYAQGWRLVHLAVN